MIDLVKEFNIDKKHFDSHETDLYILPKDDKQSKSIVSFLVENNIGFVWSYSDVSGQAWYGKMFIDVPFYFIKH